MGTAGFANVLADVMMVVTKNTRAIVPAKLSFAKTFFIEIFNFGSDPRSSAFFTVLFYYVGGNELSQRLISIDISYGDNTLEPFDLGVLFNPKKYQKYKKFFCQEIGRYFEDLQSSLSLLNFHEF
jgi:hypothetical protein